MMSIFDNNEPVNAYNSFSSGKFSKEERNEHYRLLVKMVVRTVAVFLVFLILPGVCGILGSCATKKISNSEYRSSKDVVSQIESILHSRTVVQQDSAWRESVMRQFQSIREKSDTSKSVIVSAAGDTIREKIIINNVRETTSERDRLEREVLMRRIESMDSTISIMRQQQSHTDSLLSSKLETVEVPAKLSWWQQFRIHLANILLYLLVLIAAIWLFEHKLRKK